MKAILLSLAALYTLGNAGGCLLTQPKELSTLGDFAALPALSSLNESCYKLHKGKTWRDVSIGFSTMVNASLCDSNISIRNTQ